MPLSCLILFTNTKPLKDQGFSAHSSRINNTQPWLGWGGRTRSLCMSLSSCSRRGPRSPPSRTVQRLPERCVKPRKA